MTFSTGSSILASDINGFVGGQGAGIAFASDAAAQNKLAALIGIGYGSRGYGLTTTVLPVVATGGQINGASFSNMRAALNTLASHQGTSLALPAVSEFTAGQQIKANYSMSTFLSTLDTNRLNTNSGASMTLTASAYTNQRATTWGNGNNSISATINVSFTSENETRYFFNTGGEIRIALSHPAGSTQDNNWNTGLSNVGTISFKALSTSRSGTVGAATAVGYYDLTTTPQTIFSGVVGTGAYSTNSVTITAKAVTIAGANGAKGNVIQFAVIFSDSHTNAFSDLVSSGTKITMGHLKATAVVAGIETPTFTTITSL